jgi:hypothetical protein
MLLAENELALGVRSMHAWALSFIRLTDECVALVVNEKLVLHNLGTD